MKVPMSWLREYADPSATNAEIVARLSVSTCEVERVVRRGPADTSGFVVGKVLSAEKHPNADRLQLTVVDVGGKQQQIVCGAWNFGAGATVAVALPGATLPNGLTLERRELRGQMSEGMILAEDEVDLGSDHDGIMLLADDLEAGTPLVDVLPLVDDVLEVETTPNRPDLLSIYGLAREVAALFDVPLAPWPGVDPPSALDENVTVDVEDWDGCPRYIARLFRDVRIGPSPVWLRARVFAAGMRPISNVVDVTNYVMVALGSPLHAFDYETLHGGVVGVRRAHDGEQVRTLDGQLRTLDARDMVIKDGDRAIALAAIMGGEETEVTAETTSILLEAANFEPVSILKTSERLGLRSEGSNRWEKGVDPYLAEHAARLATQLIVETSGARWVGETDAHRELPARPVVELRPARTSELIGLDVPADEQRGILGRLGFEVDGDTVTVPTWRARDVTREADLVEEVARFVLDDVPFTLPSRRDAIGRLTREQQLRRTVEDVLVGLRPLRGVHAEPRGAGSGQRRTAALAAALERPVRPAHDAAAEPARRRRAKPLSRQRGRRALRDRARVPTHRRAAAGRALAHRRCRRGWLPGREGRRRHVARVAQDRSRRSSAARTRSCTPARRRSCRRAGSERCIRASRRAGARSSSISPRSPRRCRGGSCTRT